MNYRNLITVLLLTISATAFAERDIESLRVAGVRKQIIEQILLETPPPEPIPLLVTTNHDQKWTYYPGAKSHGWTVVTIDYTNRTAEMKKDDKTVVSKILPGPRTFLTAVIVSLSTRERWMKKAGETLYSNIIVADISETGEVTVESPAIGRITLPNLTELERKASKTHKSQQAGPAYPPQGVGSADP